MANTFNLGNGNWAQKTEKLLAYNAENNNYKPLPFDFDRSSTATRVNRDGLIETVGVDEPRIDFLNNTKGHLLLEPSRQNRITYSEDFSQWSTSRIDTPYVASITDPSGSLGAYTLEMSLGETNGGGVYYSGISITGFNCFSVFAKKNTADYLVLADTGTTSNAVYFNLSNGTVGTEYNATGEIENFGNGWYRCTMKYNLTSSGLKFIYISNIDGQTSNSVQGGDSIYIWGAQHEEGSYATSYIPTSGSAVTRSADGDLIQSVENVISNSDTYSFLGDFYLPKGTQGGGGEILFENTSGSSQSRIYLNLGSFIRFRTDYPATNYDITYSTLGLEGGDLVKIGLSVNNGVMKVFVNGVLRNTFGAATIDFKRIHMRAITEVLLKKYFLYNTALSDSELQALTSN